MPLPPRLAAISQHHHRRSGADWEILTPRHAPDATLGSQLEFALKYEGVQLSVLKAVFGAAPPRELEALVRAKPTGSFARRLWFLFEWLTGRTLDVEDAGKVRAASVVDEELQVALRGGALFPRHRVLNNLPGTPAFCPMVRWTPVLRQAVDERLSSRAREVIGRTHPDAIARAAAFLLLADSRSSFDIEGERPSPERTARWGQAIGTAGEAPLSLGELERLQRLVIGDDRFVPLGLRQQGGFVGERDRLTRRPLPEHVSARAKDLRSLLEGIVEYENRALPGGVDPVIAAAVVSFGFVYVHPFVDGNGRLHRWLMHHVLARAGYGPKGLIFPVSAVILRELGPYREVLRSYSRPLLSCIDWRETDDGNVEVLNDTADYYRFFDATRQAEFLYACVRSTVEKDLPDEVDWLERYDRFSQRVQLLVDMPAGTVDLLHRFLRQNDGRLSERARTKEFAALSDAEVETVERMYSETFGA